jgi:hypothetical protein
MLVDVALTVWGPSAEVAALRRLPVGYWWREGDAIPGLAGRVRPENGWALDSGLPRYRSLEEHLRALRVLVAPHVEAVAAAAHRNHAELLVAVHLDERSTETHLPADLVSWAATLGCSIGVDLFPL